MSPRSVTELVTLAERGRRVKYLMFWGHQPKADGSIGPSCLSQWWESAFTVDGIAFATAEHYMMWRKATLFGDADVASRVLAAGHPQQAKGLGREVRGFDQAVWERERYAVVLAGSVAKFGQDDALRAYLLSTGDRVLVEASPLDAIWGIGLSAKDADAWYPQRWRGLNLLGFALMQARDHLASS
ncbi:hypothetical protein Cme02nite_46780 [Catellatospora methionotrophica]|uniref:NADAR domain-containing protein n=1 Tax=Catellatospora methionotrophica TaxID=121620 RepID=A0A8J3PIF6_9ACTN|nr:NADAR family protein [Catellatospora methionotrophica]GIG16346.1 hypothetical protein Cme02nite_46780 [Catellatospora methionotrophica]